MCSPVIYINAVDVPFAGLEDFVVEPASKLVGSPHVISVCSYEKSSVFNLRSVLMLHLPVL